MQDLTIQDRQQLKQILDSSFSLNELYDLCFDLGIDHEKLSPDKTGICRDIITFHQNRQNLGCLLIEIMRRRPNIFEIQNLLQKHPACNQAKKIILTFPEPDPNLIPKVKQLLAQMLGVEEREVAILTTLQGSWNLLISVPKKNWDDASPHIQTLIQEIQKEGIPIQSITSFDQITESQKEKYKIKYLKTIFQQTYTQAQQAYEQAYQVYEQAYQVYEQAYQVYEQAYQALSPAEKAYTQAQQAYEQAYIQAQQAYKQAYIQALILTEKTYTQAAKTYQALDQAAKTYQALDQAAKTYQAQQAYQALDQAIQARGQAEEALTQAKQIRTQAHQALAQAEKTYTQAYKALDQATQARNQLDENIR